MIFNLGRSEYVYDHTSAVRARRTIEGVPFVQQPGLIESWMKKAGWKRNESGLRLGTGDWLPTITPITANSLEDGLRFLKAHRDGYDDGDVDGFAEELNKPFVEYGISTVNSVKTRTIVSLRMALSDEVQKTAHARTEYFVRQVLAPRPRAEISYVPIKLPASIFHDDSPWRVLTLR